MLSRRILKIGRNQRTIRHVDVAVLSISTAARARLVCFCSQEPIKAAVLGERASGSALLQLISRSGSFQDGAGDCGEQSGPPEVMTDHSRALRTGRDAALILTC